MLYDQIGRGKTNMAAPKQEVHIYQLVDVIETKVVHSMNALVRIDQIGRVLSLE